MPMYTVLQTKCPCSLENCEVYKNAPTKLKATPEHVFYIQETVNERYRYNPEHAVLCPMDRYASQDIILNAIDDMKETCRQCRAAHPINPRDKSYRPARIELNLYPLPKPVLESCKTRVKGS